MSYVFPPVGLNKDDSCCMLLYIEKILGKIIEMFQFPFRKDNFYEFT